MKIGYLGKANAKGMVELCLSLGLGFSVEHVMF